MHGHEYKVFDLVLYRLRFTEAVPECLEWLYSQVTQRDSSFSGLV